MSDTLPIDLNSAALKFRIAHSQRCDGWIQTTQNNMSKPGVFALAGAKEQDGGEPPPLAVAVPSA